MNGKKQFTRWVLIVTVLFSIAWMTNVSYKKVQTSKTAKARTSSLPELHLLTSDSLLFDFSNVSNRTLALIHFNSECDHCQYEANDIKRNIEAFENANLVFMSVEPLFKINEFANTYGLDSCQNVSFTKIKASDASATFGSLFIPHVFIYGPDKKLRKEFKGETKVEAILKYLD